MLIKKNILIFVFAAVIGLLLVFTLINYSKIAKLSAAQEQNKQLILNETSGSREDNDYLNNISGMLAYDLNRTRASLGLDTRNYPFRNISEEDSDTISAPQNKMIDAVTALLDAESSNKKSVMLGRFFNNPVITEVLEQFGTEPEKYSNEKYIIRYSGFDCVNIEAVSENEIKLTGIDGVELSINNASNESSLFIEKNIEAAGVLAASVKQFSADLAALPQDKQLTEKADSRIMLKLSGEQLSVSNTVNSEILRGSVSVSGTDVFYSLSSNSEKYGNLDSFRTALMQGIASMDLRSEEEVMIDNAKAEIETEIADPEFLQYLAGMNLSINPEAREDLDYFYYDIFHDDGKRLGSLSVLKKLGDIYLVDADEVPVSSLKTLRIKQNISSSNSGNLVIPENIPEIDSLYSNSDSVTFLLVGNHELNTDTMILVHADRVTGKAYLIGIPRDLYWKGRKINSVYQQFGADQFKKELSEITGLEITNYIIVDMYAFIDLVNILGGIEVTLDEDLVDSTYRIRDNGEWSTLNYPKGTYRLNGVEALRIARSRHGSNDFDRSHRQQLILEAFMNRILEFKLTDINKVYSMMQAMFEYVDTDFTLVELMSLFNNYSDVELAGKFVLSFDNILYDTYSNIYLLDDPDMELDADFNKGAWILLPRENNWNNIRWYIRQVINGEI